MAVSGPWKKAKALRGKPHCLWKSIQAPHQLGIEPSCEATVLTTVALVQPGAHRPQFLAYFKLNFFVS